MKTKLSHKLLLTILALIFTIGLTFISVELPGLVDSFVSQKIDFPDIGTGADQVSAYKTELYLDHYHLRLIGYACFALIIILIVIGFIFEKTGMSSTGAVILFLPVFGQFALTMFFLGGLGFLRLIWLPFLDVSFDVFRLGDIILLPYKLIIDISAWAGLSIWRELPYVITGIGLLLFMLGTLTWFYSKFQKKDMVDFWIYRISRHPQYLGWIIWSYGMMFLQGPNIKKMFTISNSLPWLLMTIIIIGVALLEELKMSRMLGEKYISYCQQTPFLLPLPRFLSRIFLLPLRIFFKKDFFERKREILTILGFYTLLCMLLSAFYSGLITLHEKTLSEKHIEKLTEKVRESSNRNDKRNAASKLAEIGLPAIDSLIALLNDDDLYVRWYTANVLGNVQSDKLIQPLFKLLDDPERNVRRAAAGALGRIGSKEAIQPLINALEDESRGISIASARALGQLKSNEALEPLIEALNSENKGIAGAAAEALGALGDQAAIPPLIKCLDEQKNCPYNEIGWALWELGSERSVDAFIGGLNEEKWWRRSANVSALGKIKSEKGMEPLIGALNDESEKVRRSAVLALMELSSHKTVEALSKALNDEDFEVRMYAREALRRLGNPRTARTSKD